ncbi:MAG TPA: hypothetical protein VHJ37_04955, partial [Thermoleophilaceae bacterium]|nr:hypothetical protein [Thermoleophilaceae bacterium]
RRPRDGGAGQARGVCLNHAIVNNDLSKRLMWSGLLAGMGALVSIIANRLATEIWIRVFKEDPPTD